MAISTYTGKPGEGMQFCNRAAWMSIADFLTHENLRLVLKARAQAQAAAGQQRAAAAAQGAAQTLPVGNHGEIVLQGARHD